MKNFKLTINICLIITIVLGLSSCIMTKDPHYQSNSSYLNQRYDELVYNAKLEKLTSADIDEAYFLSTIYIKKRDWRPAKNLLKIVFDSQKSLHFGLIYIDVLNQLGEKQEAKRVSNFLAVLYDDNEIQDQKRIIESF